VSEIAPAYDYSLVPEAFRLDDYRRVGANPIYCQEAANPDIYHPMSVERDLDVVFVGARYGERPAYIRHLVDAGVAVRVFGPGWQRPVRSRPAEGARKASLQDRVRRRLRRILGVGSRREVPRATRLDIGGGVAVPATPQPVISASPDDLPAEVCGPKLTDDEMVEMYSRARISLGFSSVGQTHPGGERIVQVRLRDFEAPMSGAFYMVEEMPELRQFYEIGREVVTYDGPDDLVEKCRYYLEHDEERERIRVAGHTRALRDHTWQRRFRDVFRTAGLPETGVPEPGSGVSGVESTVG
jgi:spore maturation protein CgeB